jgi:HEAT repeat protein
VLLAGLIIGGWMLRRFGQPSFQGKTLSEWLDRSGPNFGIGSRALADERAAVRQMGPKTIPYLIDWFDDEPLFNSRSLTKVLRFLPARFVTPSISARLMQRAQDNELRYQLRAAAAADALGILGEQARPAIPGLIRVLRKQRNWYSTSRAAEVLSKLGPVALPGLLNVLMDPTFSNQVTIVQLLGWMGNPGPAGQPFVAILCGYLAGSDSRLQVASIETLGSFGLSPEQSVPALVNSLTNAIEKSDVTVARKSAEALGQFGTNASSGVPALCKAQENSDGITTEEAARALGHIGTAPELAVPALMTYFHAENTHHRKYAIEGLTGYGAAAREAVPLAREALTDPDHDTRALAAAFLQTVSTGQ